jgi:penicillin-binding protein 1C
LPPPLRHFQLGQFAGEAAQASLHILYPPDGARLDVGNGSSDIVPLKVTGATAPLTVLVNGVPVEARGRGALFFKPDGPGFSRVTVIDSTGASASVTVRVDDGSIGREAIRATDSACPVSPCINKAMSRTAD